MVPFSIKNVNLVARCFGFDNPPIVRMPILTFPF